MTKTLQECIQKRSNNLGFLKFLAALLVIYSHSYYICMGSGHSDPLNSFTGGVVSFGAIAVAIFMFASGLFVTKSIYKYRTWQNYFYARLIRIYPLFITIMFLTVFLIGPIVTNVSLVEYFTSIQTYEYFSYLFMIPNYSLTGVFVDNPTSLVNGPLWTLVLEMICYIGLYVLYRLNFLDKKKSKLLIGLGIIGSLFISFEIIPFIYALANYLRPFTLFFIGCLFYVYRDKIILSRKIAIVFIALFCVLFLSGNYTFAILLCLPYILTYISYADFQVSPALASLGNISYAIYLIAYPIQQMVRMYIPSVTPIQNTLLSQILTICVAYILYRYIEKPVTVKLQRKC